jgi:hypothetical protein
MKRLFMFFLIPALTVVMFNLVAEAQVSLSQINAQRNQVGLPPLTGNMDVDVEMLQYECSQGIMGSCQLLGNAQSMPTSPPPPSGESFGNAPSPARCIADCTNAWALCHKTCRFIPSLDDEDIERGSNCRSQCDTEKSSCEAMCH